MSAAIPLQLFPVRGRAPLYTLLTILLVVWICMLFASANKARGAGDGIRYVLEASSLLIGAIGALQMRGLARARELIARQQMPELLWRQWLCGGIVETSLIWAVLGATMGTLLASRASTMPWPGALALLSASLCIGAAGVLASEAMLAQKLRLLVNAIGAALLIAGLWLDVGHVVAWFMALPLASLALLTLCWPLLGTVLVLSWRRPLGTSRNIQAAARRSGPLAAINRELRRYSPLDRKNAWSESPQHAPMRARLGWLVNATFPVYIYFNSFSPLGWSQEPDLRQLLSLGMLSLFMSRALIARDLHWRSMLMPGGWRRGRIASDIFAASLKIQFAVMAIVVCVFVLAARLFEAMPIIEALRIVADHALLAPTVVLAVSTGLVLRALERPQLVLGTGFALIVAGWAYARFVVGYSALWHWPANPVLYAALMTTGAFAMLGVANRMWTPEKLIACARRWS